MANCTERMLQGIRGLRLGRVEGGDTLQAVAQRRREKGAGTLVVPAPFDWRCGPAGARYRAMTNDGDVQISQSAGLLSSPSAFSTDSFIT